MNPVSTWDGTMVATEGEVLNFSTPKSPENAFSGNFTYLKLVRNIIILPFFSIYFAKPTMNHCKNRLLTWIYSVFFALPIAVTQLKHQKMKYRATYCNFYKKLKIWACFPQNRRFRDQTGGWETTSKNGRVGTYAFFIEHLWWLLLILDIMLFF